MAFQIRLKQVSSCSGMLLVPEVIYPVLFVKVELTETIPINTLMTPECLPVNIKGDLFVTPVKETDRNIIPAEFFYSYLKITVFVCYKALQAQRILVNGNYFTICQYIHGFFRHMAYIVTSDQRGREHAP